MAVLIGGRLVSLDVIRLNHGLRWEEPLMSNPHWSELENLVIVAGHAVYTAHDFHRPADDASWYLQPFQMGEPPFYIEHIRRGVHLANEDRKALLVFSGGQTRYEAGPRGEAQSYWLLADFFNWWWQTNVRLRAVTEEFARDSFENLLFSICRFHECVGKYPRLITVVSWQFKKGRFDLHRTALRWDDPKRYVFNGVNNPVDLIGAQKGERNNALDPFEKDRYGTGSVPHEIPQKDGTVKIVDLGEKRRERNPFQRTHPYVESCKDLAGLLEHPGPDYYEDALPSEWGRADNQAMNPSGNGGRGLG